MTLPTAKRRALHLDGECRQTAVVTDPSGAARNLADRQAIHDVLVTYARSVDRRDLPRVAACFTEDAAYDGALSSSTIREALTQLPESWQRYVRTQHFLGNQLIEIDGDAAHSETYAIAFHQLRVDTEWRQRSVAICYVDDLERCDGSWRIRKRRVQRLFSREEPLPGGLPEPERSS
jgi:3-phenylpropionate/cinnamic acid dioxygenase small subunit